MSFISSYSFKEVDADGSGDLDLEEFQVFLDRLRVRQEIVDLFEKIAKKGSLSPEEFVSFCKQQKVTFPFV